MTKTRNRGLDAGEASVIADALNTKSGYVSNVINGHRNNANIKRAHQRLRELKLKSRQEWVSTLKTEFQKP
jgi:hypothetical protein